MPERFPLWKDRESGGDRSMRNDDVLIALVAALSGIFGISRCSECREGVVGQGAEGVTHRSG